MNVCVCICVYMYVCVYVCMYIKAKCEKSTETSSKVATYLTMHPTLEVHPIYYLPHTILDEKRVEFSRFRLSAHRLKVVTGRWMRTPAKDARARVIAPHGRMKDMPWSNAR